MLDIPGKFLGLIIAFLLCIIGPAINITTQQEMITRRNIITSATNLLDEVVDSRTYTPEMRNKFATEVNSYGCSVDFDVIKEARTVDAGAATSDTGAHSAVVHYITVPLDYDETFDVPHSETVAFKSGDRVGIHLKRVSYSGSQYIVKSIAGIFLPDFDYTMYERVR